MASAKRYLLIAFSFVLALTAFTIISPRALHAITATLVQVVNTASNPIPVQAVPAKQAVQLSGDLLMSDGVATGGTLTFTDPVTNTGNYTVPAGKRMVVDSSAGQCTVSAGQKLIWPALYSSTGGMSFRTQLDGTWASVQDVYTLAGDAPIYADPGSTVRVKVARYPYVGDASCHFYVSGHLEDIQ